MIFEICGWNIIEKFILNSNFGQSILNKSTVSISDKISGQWTLTVQVYVLFASVTHIFFYCHSNQIRKFLGISSPSQQYRPIRPRQYRVASDEYLQLAERNLAMINLVTWTSKAFNASNFRNKMRCSFMG